MSKTITELVHAAHNNAVSKGWWEEERSFAELIALMHSELSEALEDIRNGKKPDEVWYEYKNWDGRTLKSDLAQTHLYNPHTDISTKEIGKPCGVPSELADVVIRVFDACGRYGIDLETAITEKMAYNATRPQRHGGKKL